MNLPLLALRNLARNPLRTLLTALGTMVLVFVVTLVWSILAFLDYVTAEKSTNFKALVTERWRIPSQMPYSYAASLREAAARDPDDVRPLDSMTWTFYGGTLDTEARTREGLLFAFCLQPEKLRTMMDELDSLPPEVDARFAQAVEALQTHRQGIILGRDRLRELNKRVGDRFTLYGLNYKDINLEVEIVGQFPEGRYDNSAAMNIEYLLAALDAYPQSHQGQAHPMADRCLNLVWLRLPDRAAFDRAAEQVTSSPFYTNPAVKVETEASGIATFMEAYRDLLWGMRWLLAPAVIVTLSLVVANAISISVRERLTEFAVMKVLGFRPGQILLLVLGESVVVGGLAGLASAALTLYVVNDVFGGLKFPIAFFGTFLIPEAALVWGGVTGAGAALAGSLAPAWTARSVRVAEIFARTA